MFEEKIIDDSVCGRSLEMIAAYSNGMPVSGFIVDKGTGEPVPCDYNIWEVWDEGMSGILNHRRLLGSGSTDESGHFSGLADFKPFGVPYELEFTDGVNFLVKNGCVNGSTDKPVPVIIRIYTDRQCYRPGDVIRLGCLAYKTDGLALGRTLAASDISLSLFDSTWKLLDTASLLTDSFGLVEYEFHIQEGALDGRYTIKACCEDDYSACRAIIVSSEPVWPAVLMDKEEIRHEADKISEPKFVTVVKDEYEVGETMTFKLSAESGDYLYYIIQGRFGIVASGFEKSDGHDILIEMPVTAEMYGTVKSCFYKYHCGTCLHQKKFINIPYSDRELTLTVEQSMPDPGHMASCRVHVARNDGSPAYASLIVGMYVDALDGNSLNHWVLSPWNSVLPEEPLFLEDDHSQTESCNTQTGQYSHRSVYVPGPVLFLPSLRTDREGNAGFTFEVPRCIGCVRLQILALTEKLSVGTLEI